MMKKISNYRGTFSKDELPSVINKDESCIVNLDNQSGPGSHWVAVYNSAKDPKNVYYFDSYGMPPANHIANYMKTSGKKIIYNSSQLQGLKNTTCGYYCMYVITELNKGKSYYDVLYQLKQLPVEDNDLYIIKYFKAK